MPIRKSYRTHKAGSISRLKLVEEELPDPKANEVQVKVKAVGLNFADVFAILGLYSATPEGSFIPGLEYSGEIVSIGQDVNDFEIGDRVMGVTRFGAYTSQINIDTAYVSKIPQSWTFEEGASFLVQALTAYYGLFHLGNLQKGDAVLIHSAAGGVGLLANRMAQKAGAFTIGTIGSAAKIDLLKAEGYQKYIVRSKHFKKDLKQALEGRDLNLIMECIGGKIFTIGYNMLAPQGRVINYGSARYGDTKNSPNWPRLAWLYLTRPKIDPQKMIETNKGILGFNLIWLYDRKELMQQILKELEEFNMASPYIGHRFKFDDMHEALRLFQSGKTVGKVVLTLG
ncbi:alcohol dehydrogenase [Marivirga tractuosa]|uniref:Alcohol dehydrogenase zinc-binding domain protein n=1 Tax=Marivirga tractuosa (strain ATCC 23168 / DSM 4126 / NBRC 15989 / NCIMB 1408 / VKM B-1430 / H-43) TaxID=643867 RepID=E4TP76_MARTH|nr:medium chain dehydrogenase/reductase family protein [Marivirga tractuosa]ADR20479.1 Alcohol dehydrogenase zinc-binding domain protein [Marivirga tractuosa DSM 4126]BDD15075.1 alcohol dehydrogenase [Marivirga tractuosa]